jgi:type VI secretion system protein VasD
MTQPIPEERRMSHLRTIRFFVILMLITLSVAACGATQAIHDGTVTAAKWAFATQIHTMDLDVINLTGDGTESAIVRVYQLKSPEAFNDLTDAQWLTDDLAALKNDILAANDVVLLAGASRSLRTPMNENFQYIGVIALPTDGSAKPVRLLIPKKQWAKINPVLINLDENGLHLYQRSQTSRR